MNPPVIETCDNGHNYYKPQDVPTRCPYCLVEGLDQARRELECVKNNSSSRNKL